MNDHIPKPVDPPALYRTLWRWLKQAAPVSPDAPTPVAPSPPSGPTADDATLADLALVPGLDTQAGLRSVRGQASKLQTLLQRFAHEHADDAEAARAALQAPNNALMADGVRCLHTLKGLAGTLGLQAVQAAAERAEQSFRDAESTPALQNALLDELAYHLTPAVEGIRRYLPPWVTDTSIGLPQATEPSKHPAGAAPSPALLAQLDKWRALLAADDLQASDMYPTLRAELINCWPEASIKRMDQAMDDYAMPDALEQLDAWLQTLQATSTA